jgi:protocatechuate 3,4-dioxygenase beta subunit
MNKLYIIASIIATCIFSAMAELPHIDIDHNITPSEIWATDSEGNLDPDSATITLKISGDGEPFNFVKPIDVVFAIDSSGSMGSNDPDGHRITAAQEFIDKLNPYKDRAGMVSWDDGIVFDQALTSDFNRAKQSVADVGVGGGTNLDSGLARSIDLLTGMPRSSIKVIIFLSDGDGGYVSSGMPESQADRARSADILIYSIGLGNDSNEDPLNDMANSAGGRYFHSTKSTNLESIYQDIFRRISRIAAKNLKIEYTLPGPIQSYDTNADMSTDTDGNSILKWNIGQISLDETRDLSFSVKSRNSGIFMLGGNSRVEYVNYNEISESISITPEALKVKRPIKVGDRIWVDKNANGIQDPDEKGKAGIKVALLDAEKKPTGRTTVTDANGSYQLNVLSEGTYYIQVASHAGYILSPQHLGANEEKDCDFVSEGISRPLHLGGQSDFSIDAGLVPNDCISGRIWIDANKNGMHDDHENAYSGASVYLLDSFKNLAGPVNLTDTNGSYEFNRLEPGSYYVRFKAPNGTILSPKILGGDEEDIYPGSYGTSREVVLTDGCDRDVDMAIILLCRNSIYLKDISREDLVDYSAMIRLFGINFPDASEDELVHIFISDSEGRPLPYWIENWNATASTARIWVRIPFIPIGNETEVIMQYYSENSSESTIENPHGTGRDVFEFFDDFEDNSLDKMSWSSQAAENGSVTEQDGKMQIHTDAGFKSSADLALERSFAPGRAMRFKANISTGQSYDRKGMGFMNTNVGEDTNSVGPSIYWRAQDGDLFAHHIIPVQEMEDPDVKLMRGKSNYEGRSSIWEIKWLDSRIIYVLDSQSFVHDMDGSSSVEMSPRFSLNSNMTSLPSDISVDWVLVRRCVELEPTTRFGQRICANEGDIMRGQEVEYK